MKKLIFPALFIIGVLSVNAQTDKAGLLQSLEANSSRAQVNTVTATLKSSTRLFKAKEDLTSVILIIPSGSVVSVIDSDSTYLHITFEENEGYIFKKHAVIDKTPVNISKEMQASQAQPEQSQTDSRYDALESKYGSAMAARIYAGKIWKGMNSEMVRDSWGTTERINRVINGNVIREEWFYRSTWLYFENNTLLDWGPVKR
jgi:hypothetical protein